MNKGWRASNEVIRKFFHMSAIWIPITAYMFPYSLMQTIFSLLACFVMYIDFLRLNRNGLLLRCINFTRANIVLREREHAQLTGASYMLISASICACIFDKKQFIIAFSILTVSDAVAAICGSSYGRVHILGKTLEGSVSFLMTSCVIVVVLANLFEESEIFILNALVASMVATVIELISGEIKIDDNLSIPIVFCTVMFLLDNFYI